MADTTRRRWLVRLALLAVIALLVYFLRPRGGPERPAQPAPPTAVTREPIPPSRWKPPPAQPKSLRPPTGAPLVPIIDEVTVEKPVVCRGEENLISIKAHTPGNAEDAYLSYFVSSETGQSVPLRLHDRSDEAQGVQRDVIVFGRNGVATKVALPPYTIEDCDAPRMLQIAAGLVANSESTYRLEAKIRDIAADAPMSPTSYHWEFSDDTSADTTVPTVEHDFGDRAQDSLNSQVFITCTAIEGDERVMGRKQLQIRNPAFEELTTKGLVRLSTAMNPRFPEADDDGRVRQEVHVWHYRPDAVDLTRVIVTKNFTPESGRAPEVHEVAATTVLHSASVPPGVGLTVRMELDTKAEPDVAYLDYYLEGSSEEGWPAHGNFAVMAPPPMPTRENSQPVLSAYMKAKILRARELLGKEYVTDEDIWNLEREGKMADLHPEDFPAPPEATEPARPAPAPAPR